MVLYKRKPIVLPTPKALPSKLSCRVWHIKETGEWFVTYQEYLDRMDFYMKHFFTCEITGTSCLTFFDALNSEEYQFKNVEEKFPLKLREPVARFLHFNEVRRLDLLVEQVYAKFKSDFFPGEIVYLRKNRQEMTPNPDDSQGDGERQMPQVTQNAVASNNNAQQLHYQKPYVIKEKAHFNALIDPVTRKQLSPAYSKYMLTEENAAANSNYVIFDQSQIYRDRSTFTKHLIKCFCKITLRRASSKIGAPWCVKEEYLPIYGITMEWPPEMSKYKDDPVETRVAPSTAKRSYEEFGAEELPYMIEENKTAEYSTVGNTGEIKKRVKKEDAYNSNPTSNGTGLADEDTKRRTQEQADQVGSEFSIQADTVPVTSIMEDMILPYVGPHRPLSSLSMLNNELEYIPVNSGAEQFNEFQKLIQCYTFLNTFSEKLFLSYFTWDDFITSIKCTDVKCLSGKYVEVRLTKGDRRDNNGEISEDDSLILEGCQTLKHPSVPKDVYEYINSKNNGYISYVIQEADTVDDTYLDAINENGSALLVECFVALLRLFLDEDSTWKTVVMENWYDDDDANQDKYEEFDRVEHLDGNKENNNPTTTTEGGTLHSKSSTGSPNQNGNESKAEKTNGNINEEEDSHSEQENSEDSHNISNPKIDSLLEKCLNFRKITWSERLTKRQFQNGFWIITLLGIYQDCMHLPMYTEFIHHFIEAVIPKESTSQLNKILWRNFCKNLTSEQKVTAIWILVDLCSNFSQDIKDAVETSMELCGKIRSERYKVGRDLKSESQKLSELQESLKKLPIEAAESTEAVELANKIKSQEEAVSHLQDDKVYLDRVLYENDFQRLRPLGVDRYGNKYYWLEFCGVPRSLPQDKETKVSLKSGRIWIQGPNSWNASFILGVSQEQVDSWNHLRYSLGAAEATKTVFKVYRADDGSYRACGTNSDQEDVELVNAKGIVTTTEKLTALQKKIIDETPEALLLTDSQWYCINSIDDYNTLVDWWDNWGRREHDLLKQVKSIEAEICSSLEHDLLSSNIRMQQQNLKQQLQENELIDEELHINSTDTEDENDEQFKDDEQLEAIANEIMKLDDSSKTRKILTRIRELERERDALLARKRSLETSNKASPRVQLRTERRRYRTSRDKKLKLKEEILTELINLPFTEPQNQVIKWENEVAKKFWKVSLTKGANGKPKVDVQHSVEDKISSVLKNTLKHQDSAAA
ncbi:HER104Cp [Eremothecium sinecaudum]|uniref:HER104Cp n=1 Tax=Eremothecium sinecaudum TaxID=45286 RepID=A0A0X8HU01_9SACH|nr:HER104Cp [Eremothecium sinecaudum]AMD21383.1 HER104Cp [Eremothecium sinecaudum]